MPESEIIEKVRYQEILYLAGQRQGTAAYAQRVCHARHRLKEVVLGRSHGEHITQGLFCIFGYDVLATEQVFHIDGKEAEHQFLDFLLVTVVPGFNLTVKRSELVCRTVSRFAECLDITVKHGQELYRIQFLAVKRHFHVKIISTDGYRLTCFYLLSETDEYISKMRIGHFVFAIAYDNIYTMLFVRTDT